MDAVSEQSDRLVLIANAHLTWCILLFFIAFYCTTVHYSSFSHSQNRLPYRINEYYLSAYLSNITFSQHHNCILQK